VTQLRLAADSGSRHARAAHRMLAAVEPAAAVLEDALRRAVYTLDSDATEVPMAAGTTGAGPGSTTVGRTAPDAGTR